MPTLDPEDIDLQHLSPEEEVASSITIGLLLMWVVRTPITEAQLGMYRRFAIAMFMDVLNASPFVLAPREPLAIRTPQGEHA